MASKNFTVKELAKITKCKIIGNENHIISGVNSLEAAVKNEASFIANSRYSEALKKSKAGVICIDSSCITNQDSNFLVSDNPSKAFQLIAELILSTATTAFKDIHPSAVIHSTATLSEHINVGPNVVIDQNAHISDGTTIYPNTYIGANVKIGKNCTIYSNVSIRENTIIGDNVVIQPGAVIGSCGFGFVPDSNGKYQKLKQIGNVIIEDDVEIGANVTIDRARFNKTIIKNGVKIDNLVQIAHNVEIDENTVIAAQTGISGSTVIGKNVILGGQVGIAGHLNISDHVMVGAQSGISKNLSPGKYRGSPAAPISQWNREYIHVRKLAKYVDRIKNLEKQISEIQSTKND